MKTSKHLLLFGTALSTVVVFGAATSSFAQGEPRLAQQQERSGERVGGDEPRRGEVQGRDPRPPGAQERQERRGERAQERTQDRQERAGERQERVQERQERREERREERAPGAAQDRQERQERSPTAQERRDERAPAAAQDRGERREERGPAAQDRRDAPQQRPAAQDRQERAPAAAQDRQERREERTPAAQDRQERREERAPAAVQQERQERAPAAQDRRDERAPAAAQDRQERRDDRTPAAQDRRDTRDRPAAEGQPTRPGAPGAPPSTAQDPFHQERSPATAGDRRDERREDRRDERREGRDDRRDERPTAQDPLRPLAPAAAAPLEPRGRGAGIEVRTERGEVLNSIQDLRGQRRETREGDRVIIREPGRVIIREDGRDIIRHSEVDRFRYGARDVQVRRQGDETVTVVERPDGARIITVVDEEGRLIRRTRRDPRGQEIVIIDNGDVPRRGPRGPGLGVRVDLPPPTIRIPRERYIVEAEDASPQVIYETLTAAPVERIDRRYSLEEVRYSPTLRERMPRVDLNTVTFEFGSWELTPDQIDRLAVIAEGLKRAIDRNPREVFLIEGHTDAVGPDVDNLSLSDRRAETVAVALTQQFGVPAENLTTQGYGEQYLKVQTDAPERQNRRVTLRRITPLLQGQADASPPPARR